MGNSIHLGISILSKKGRAGERRRAEGRREEKRREKKREEKKRKERKEKSLLSRVIVLNEIIDVKCLAQCLAYNKPTNVQ